MNLGNLTEDQRRQLNELLSASTISSIGGQGYLNGQREGRLSDLMNPQPQPQMMPDGMPENYIQRGNNPPIPIQPSPRSMGPALDYSSAPVDFGGMKGYRVKGDPMSIVMADGRIVRMGADTGADRKRMMDDLQMQEARQKLAGGLGGQDWMKDFDGSGKLLLVNRRTGEIKRPSEDITGAQYSPELAGRIVTAKDSASQAVKKTGAMDGLAGTIETAQTLLEGKGAGQKDLPTSSSFGSAYDVAAGWFGASPGGAAEAQKLKVLGGALTSKMPRMEGPQSDKDTQAYREMAGMVGDETIPIARRLAALEEVKNLWAKYDKQSTSIGGGKHVTVTNDAEYNALPKGAIYITPTGETRTKR